MGLQIGAASIAVSSLNTAGINRPDRSTASAVSNGDVGLRATEEPQGVQAGFGDNTLSPLGAALETLDSNLAVSRDLVPSVEELRERARVVQAERLEETPTRRLAEGANDLRQRESVRPAPSPDVQNFVDQSAPRADVAAAQELEALATPNNATAPPAEAITPPQESLTPRLNLQA